MSSSHFAKIRFKYKGKIVNLLLHAQSKKYKDPLALAILKIFIYFVNLLLHAQGKI